MMSVVRTSLSLIGFGSMLVSLGNALVLLPVMCHVRFMRRIGGDRDRLARYGLQYDTSEFPVSYSTIDAVTVLLLGFVGITNMVFGIELS